MELPPRWALRLCPSDARGQKSIDPLLIFSPRANVRFNPTKDLSLRLSYSEGFRAPQFFDEEMHVTLAGGEPKERVLAKDLKEERSRSLSASFDWYTTLGKGWQLNLMVKASLPGSETSSLQTMRMVSSTPRRGARSSRSSMLVTG